MVQFDSLSLLVLRPKLVLLLNDVLLKLSLCFFFCFFFTSETRRLLYFFDTGSHVVPAIIQQWIMPKFINFKLSRSSKLETHKQMQISIKFWTSIFLERRRRIPLSRRYIKSILIPSDRVTNQYVVYKEQNNHSTLKVLVFFALVYGISTMVRYCMPNPFYTYLSNIYELVWLVFMAYQLLHVIQCQILFTHVY